MAASENEEDEPSRQMLRERVEELETLIAGVSGTGFFDATKKMTDLSAKLDGIFRNYQELQQGYDVVRNFYNMYDTFRPLLENNDPFQSPKTSNPEILNQKIAIILSANLKIQNTVELLRQLEEFRPQLSRNSIEDTEAVSNKISSIELNTQSLIKQALEFRTELEVFLDDYNQMCYLVSQKFMEWDAILTKMESQLGL